MATLDYARRIAKAEFDKLCDEHSSTIPAGSNEVGWFASMTGKFVAAILNYRDENYGAH